MRADDVHPRDLACGVNVVPPITPGKCSVKTTFNSTVAGLVVPGKQMNVEMSGWEIFRGTDRAFSRGVFLP